MFEIKGLLILIPAMPLAAAVLTAVLGPRVLRARSHLPTVLAIGLSFVASLLLVFQVQREAHRAHDAAGQHARIGYAKVVSVWSWASVDDAYQLPLPVGEGRGEGSLQARSTQNTLTPTLSQRERGPEKGLSQRERAPVDFRIDVTLRADPLTAIMLATVTLISFLVAVYSIGYMHGDRGYWRFFSYIGLFVFSMTMLVSVSNFVLLYVFWEAVGLCSYLLIGFWYHKPEAAAAGKKAFLVNRVGDFGFALGVFLLWTTYGTLNFHDSARVQRTGLAAVKPAAATRVLPDTEVPEKAKVLQRYEGVLGQTLLANQKKLNEGEQLRQGAPRYATGALATAICLLLMLGACGKSAQFPLHVWLPDAMEGPTPVSALIHAATMVTAGVYMVTRCMPLFLASVGAQQTVAVIGAFTALMAALVALTQTDLKRILAYSTISQLGYMFLGLGAGTLLGATAGMFHLFTHAFFKALLFLGAGSVMHAMGGVIDVRRFGGLRRIMPWTHATFLVGCLALAGVFPFAGFWSKDLILAEARGAEGTLYMALYLLGVFTAGLTAFYTFRAFFLTFYGKEEIPHEAGHHAHESPPSMIVPLVVLAAGSLVLGAYCELTGGFAGFLAKTPSLALIGAPGHEAAAEGSHLEVAVTSTVIALVGIGLAWFLYLGREGLLRSLTRAMDAVGLYRLSYGKFFFDQIYCILVVWPLEGLARLSYWVDRYVIDRLVNLCGLVPVAAGATMRSLQSGLLPLYALAMVLGLLVLMGALRM